MVHLHLSTLDLTKTRFAYSPLWETVMGYRAMLDSSRFAIHLPWVCEATESTRGLDLSLLRALVQPFGYIPDFVTPPPVTALPEFEDEIRALLATPVETVQQEISRLLEGNRDLSDELEVFRSDPQGALLHLADQLRFYWSQALEPHWPRLRAMLENDILLRARSLALGGAEALFKDLHPLVRFQNGALSLDQSLCNGDDGDVHLGGRGLLLMPSAFVWPRLSTILGAPWQPTLAYTPRGVANLWIVDPPPVERSLELLLGQGHAAVLLSLEPPSSTLEIARRLGLVASGVSEHLSVLRLSGLIESQRRGRFVYYRLSQTGVALLELLNLPKN